MSTRGRVILVGAGPGDPSLITLKGLKSLSQADVILYDYLVNPVVLDHAITQRGAAPLPEIRCLGQHGQGRLIPQTEVNELMIAAARQGKSVVRLKGGDPAIFGRTAEEVAALEQAGIQYEIVPGVTSGLAASSYAGIPLTHRDVASCVAFVTGQECRDKLGSSMELSKLAQFPGTLVFYMGVTSAPVWSNELIACGKPADTPVAIVRHCSLPNQQVLKTTLGQLHDELARIKMRPPAIVIVGEAVNYQAGYDWFGSEQLRSERPLFGQTVLVTRPRHQAEDTVVRLRELGAMVLCQPGIDIVPVADFSELDRAIAQLEQVDWLVFSSSNGVHYFLDRLLELGRDLRALGKLQIAAIGPGTTTALRKRHLHADLEPQEYRAEALAEALIPLASGKRVLLIRGTRGREVLPEMLVAGGALVEQVSAYQSNDVAAPDPQIAAAIESGNVDWVTVTSSAIAESVVRLLGDHLKQSRLAAISPLTAETLSELGYPASVIAEVYTSDGLIDAIVAAESAAP